ncbi:hypothetical protein KL933_004875 [Ogataea haglerorum]|uniref:Nudix hydrolase domain-containing protein n=1 Tax=Ogataea haglerorum TaxID=1937702 RepID=A0AAN6HZ75_9ASCO|nr:hypothetical protein KL914_004606 [Ogataea haglerorum]KAG7704104.1 hypothetical protein KL950_004431 [Ogataea haglerorum]KAG7724371.1 hypothetical protein KL933_004875 [Ogataea haglerorum]KAG7736220.1 hypothetical protein KL923_004929 [Ogataea haglerorum]KAG7756825.1 hypothetical protein KL947_003545 [Ogataea haglerorum]
MSNSSNLNAAKVTNVRPMANEDAKWLQLSRIDYLSPDGKARQWEMASRRTRPKGTSVDGVGIIAIIEKDSGPEVVLQKQFRPPVEGVCIEMPAGLVDPNESLQECAMRELKEETGYVGKVLTTGPLVFNDPGFCNTNTVIVTASIDMADPRNQNPQPELEENEFIEIFTLPLATFYESLEELGKQGYKLDARLQNIAMGLKLAKLYVANHKVPLTEKGHEQAAMAGKQLKEFLNPDDSICFYTSPYLRARQTLEEIVEAISDTNIPYKTYEEPRMREQDFGNFQGTGEEMEQIWIERAQYGHFFYRIPYGESAADVYDRCASFNETLFRQFSKESFPSVLVLVTHGIWARVFLTKWFRWSVEKFEDLQNVPNCRWIVMEKDQTTQRYVLRTHLSTWSELEQTKREEQVKRDAGREFTFNSSVPLTDDEVRQVADAEARAKNEQVQKSLKMKDLFDKLKRDCQDADDDHEDQSCKNKV